MGKAHVNRKKVEDRPESDFYATPISLVYELYNSELFNFDKNLVYCDPAMGEGHITRSLKELGFNNVVGHDIRKDGKDFLQNTDIWDWIITNIPFSLFDPFVEKALESVRKGFITIMRTNAFGAYNRNKKGLWKHLKHTYILNRQLDYRTPHTRTDGLFHIGAMVSCFAVFDKEWNKDYWTTSIMDVQKYALLGSYEKKWTCSKCGSIQKEYKFSEKITCKKCESVVEYILDDKINPREIIGVK